jgi:hypothetical protein
MDLFNKNKMSSFLTGIALTARYKAGGKPLTLSNEAGPQNKITGPEANCLLKKSHSIITDD